MTSAPVLCHSDLVQASIALGIRNLQNPCGELLTSVNGLGLGQNLWFPTFNMDFGQSGRLDLADSPSQVGVLGDFVRNSPGAWRTAVPFYSVAGFHRRPSVDRLGFESFNLWGERSLFADLYLQNGEILFLGADFATFTHIHFIESFLGAPIYRYPKSFSGLVSAHGNTSRVEVEMHVRPPGNLVRYDWEKIFQGLIANDLVEFYTEEHKVFSMNSKKVTDFLVGKISSDPLYLLESTSRELVQKQLDVLGRPFEIGDFES